MENFEIPSNLEYTEEIRKFKEADPAHADLFNGVVQALVNNDAFIKKVSEEHMKNVENPHKVTKSQVGLENVPNVATDDQTPTFTQASARENIISGEKISTIFGKLMKWFVDLKAVAFSGKYTDLTDKPTIPASVRVKGNTESDYRIGDVNITPENIGLGNVPNVSTNNQTPTFTQASGRANIGSGERLSVIFSKIMKWYADLKTVAFSGKYTDLTDKPTIPAAVRVKGNAESAYRTGDVNLTAANIGALAVNGNAVSATKATQDSDGKVIKDTYLPLSGGNITGNLRLKGSGNYGNTLNFGDGDYVHISEPTEDHLEIKGSYINFVTSATGTGRFTLNGKDILTIDKIYPAGSIYMSVSATNPGTLFGGTWVRWGSGRVPIGVNESETEFSLVEKVGGSKYMQQHDHTPDTSSMGFLTYKYGSTIQRAQIQKNASSGFYTHGANAVGDLGYSLKTSESGTGASGNLQPYITCYMWKRTA